MFERLAPEVMPLLRDRAIPDRTGGNLFTPGNDGAERATDETGRTISVYSIVQRHNIVTIAVVGNVAAPGLALWSLRHTPKSR